MPIDILLVLLLISSVLTSLITEGIKKMMYDFATNFIVAVVAIVVGGLTGVVYCMTISYAWGLWPTLGVVAVLIVGSWLCAMLGYDKIKQAILQFKVLETGGSDSPEGEDK